MTSAEAPLLSLVVACYNEEEILAESFLEIRDVLEHLGAPYEIVFVDDVSRDRTREILRAIVRDNPGVDIKLILHDQNKGRGGTVTELDDLNLEPRRVGLTYGYVETEIGAHRLFSFIGRMVVGLDEDGVAGGGQLLFRIGNDRQTNLVVGGELLGGVGRLTSAVSTAVARGFPSVNVPVLSTTTVSTFSSRSSASAFRTSTPTCAPRPVPTMIAIGVASPSAHGHAMMSTAIALSRAKASLGSGPQRYQPTNATMATIITAGTNQAETRSASR